MTNEAVSDTERQVLEHLDRAQSLGVTLKEYAEAYALEVLDLYNGKSSLKKGSWRATRQWTPKKSHVLPSLRETNYAVNRQQIRPSWSDWADAMMLLRTLVIFLIVMAPSAQAQKAEKEWLGAAGQRTRAAVFRSADAGDSPMLVVVLHGDLDTGGASPLANKAASQIHGVIAAALVRPGYTDENGDTSDGVMGKTSGDNYTPEVLSGIL